VLHCANDRRVQPEHIHRHPVQVVLRPARDLTLLNIEDRKMFVSENHQQEIGAIEAFEAGIAHLTEQLRHLEQLLARIQTEHSDP